MFAVAAAEAAVGVAVSAPAKAGEVAWLVAPEVEEVPDDPDVPEVPEAMFVRV